MKNKVLNVVSVLLAVITEIWVLRSFGVSRWIDIVGGVFIMFAIPIVILPWIVFRGWLEIIFGDVGKHELAKEHAGNTESNNKKQREAEDFRFSESLRERQRKTQAEAQKRAEDARRTFLYFLSSLSAKIAKSDGHVDASEIAAVEQAFGRLGLSDSQRRFCIETFRSSVKSELLLSSILAQLAASALSHELKAIIYEILWNVACADGVLTQSEKEALQLISKTLELNSYERYYHQRVKRDGDSRFGERRSGGARSMSLEEAYEILGCSVSSTDSDVKSAYREMAKKNHPDLLRSQGLPEEMISVATRKMAEINVAWEKIRESRCI